MPTVVVNDPAADMSVPVAGIVISPLVPLTVTPLLSAVQKAGVIGWGDRADQETCGMPAIDSASKSVKGR